MTRMLLGTLVLLASVACDEASRAVTSPSPLPVAPPPVGDISGAWVGNVQWTVPGQTRSAAAVSMTLTQSGNALAGVWSSAPEMTGHIDGRLAGHGYDLAFGGDVTWNRGECFALVTVQGTATKDNLVWTARAIDMAGDCPATITDVVWKLARPRIITVGTP